MKKERLIEIVTSALNEMLCDGCQDSFSPHAYENGGSCDECRSKATEEVMKIINAQPERKKGRWHAIGNTMLMTCECGFITDKYSMYHFCPNCGSDMRGEQYE